ncbi:MAG: DNA translocase FtsK [Caldilineales bacterium]|nr:DNA translocase FtsK [Caldilineales bacterium]
MAEFLSANAEILSLIVLIVAGLLIIDLVRLSGGEEAAILRRLFGWAAWPVAMALAGGAVAALAHQTVERLGWQVPVPWRRLARVAMGGAIFLAAALGLSHLWSNGPLTAQAAWEGHRGGLVGWGLGGLPALLLGDLITSLVLVGLAGLGLGVALDIHWAGLPAAVTSWVQRHAPAPLSPPWRAPGPGQLPAPPAAAEVDRPSLLEAMPAEPAARVKRRSPARSSSPPVAPIKPKPRPPHLPPMDLLLNDTAAGAVGGDIEHKKRVIEETLASFDVPVRVVDVHIGPTVTQFGVEPGYQVARGVDGQLVQRRVRVSRIKALADDLALALEAPSLRIEAPVPGKSYVGIEVPNSAARRVSLRSVLESPQFQALGSPLAIALGLDVAGQPVAADLAKMPHLLIAGATGSGKSVCINAIVCSLLMSNGPDRLRLLLFDPKRVELTAFNGVPHLLAPVIVDVDQVVGALTWLTLQMDERYRAFARLGARHLEDYNRRVARMPSSEAQSDLAPFPYLVVVIDELADLMMASPVAVEHNVCRLAQMARATGIHLVISTQRPSVDVITGLIKANFPARIAFAVTSQTDSRVVLDTPGAEKLLGRGDMLFMRPDSSKLERIQGCYVSDAEIGRLVRFWQETMPPEELPPDAPRFPWTGLAGPPEDQDALYERAVDLIQGQERVSTSWLQRRLRVGYAKAAELMARMEADGYVGPDEGAGRGRAVLLVSDADDLDQ